ncbi:MAG: PIN domain-containing protein [Vicinamibacteria bacterium]
MTLVDTSVWVEVFRHKSTFRLESAIDFEEIVTCLPVIQEVLQGFDDEAAFRTARTAMKALPIVEMPMHESVYDHAVDLYRRARRAGVTVRSSVDCLIAACALRHALPVLHCDRDFDALARVSSLDAINIRAPKRR